jgi:membrane protein
LSFVNFAARVAARLRDTHLARTAGSLSFTTTLALVPLVTVSFSFASRFPVFETWLTALETFLLTHFLPATAASVVHEHVLVFVEQATRLTGVSVAFVVVTAVLAMATVEREFNAIWGVTRGRSLPRRLMLYAIAVTVGPVLIGASISITTWVIVHSLAVVPLQKTLGQRVLDVLPLVFMATGLTLLYKTVPARPVGVIPAVIAGIGAALAFEAAKHLFAWYLKRVPTYEIVYGALAALPAFLVWIYLCWIIVLAGAALSAALQDPGGRRSR